MNINKTKGFTLIELLVVIAIIGILSSVVLASLNSARLKARDAKRTSDLNQIQLALEMYYDDNTSNYPTALTVANLVTPGYISQIPTDPSSGLAYSYAALGTGAICSSYHLGATMEGNLPSNDLNATAGTACTGSAADFDGTVATTYDIKP